MTSVSTAETPIATLADLLEQLGGIDPARVRFRPPPGTATEQDVLDAQKREGRLCELVEQALVEKVMGFRASWLASFLIYVLLNFVVPRDLGVVTGEAGLIRLAPGLVRIPDVAFVSWERLPDRRIPTEPIPGLAPNLAIEILSLGNTAGEMARKCREYFGAGVQLVWLVDHRTRTVEVYTALDQSTLLHAEHTLDGSPVLPGFTLPLRELFAVLDRQGTVLS
jgi:Uma2 family endonuclease